MRFTITTKDTKDTKVNSQTNAFVAFFVSHQNQ